MSCSLYACVCMFVRMYAYVYTCVRVGCVGVCEGAHSLHDTVTLCLLLVAASR